MGEGKLDVYKRQDIGNTTVALGGIKDGRVCFVEMCIRDRGKAVGNEGGHDVQQGLTLGKQRVAGGELHSNAVEVVIGQHHALGGASGAAGVHHHAGVLRVIGLRGNALVLPGSKELLPVDDIGVILVLVEILDCLLYTSRCV